MQANKLIYTSFDSALDGVWKARKCVVLCIDTPHSVEDQRTCLFNQISDAKKPAWQISFNSTPVFLQTIAKFHCRARF
jgi:hypothetical protein